MYWVYIYYSHRGPSHSGMNEIWIRLLRKLGSWSFKVKIFTREEKEAHVCLLLMRHLQHTKIVRLFSKLIIEFLYKQILQVNGIKNERRERKREKRKITMTELKKLNGVSNYHKISDVRLIYTIWNLNSCVMLIYVTLNSGHCPLDTNNEMRT